MDTHQVQVLNILRSALPGVEHFVQETLAFESLSDSARIEWAVLIQHLTKLQHNKLTLQECISQIQSQNEQEAPMPVILNPTPGMFDCNVVDTTGELSTDTRINSATSSAIQNFETSNLDLIENEFNKNNTNNTIDNPFTALTTAKSEEGNIEAFVEQYTVDAENQFCCSICSKKFIRKHHLRQHLIIHSGDRPYHCSFCVRKFLYPSLLREHLKLHLDPPFQCTYCTQKFIHKREFDKHMRTHLKGKPLACNNCSKYYRTRWLLKIHVDKCHKPTDFLTAATENKSIPSFNSNQHK